MHFCCNVKCIFSKEVLEIQKSVANRDDRKERAIQCNQVFSSTISSRWGDKKEITIQDNWVCCTSISKRSFYRLPVTQFHAPVIDFTRLVNWKSTSCWIVQQNIMCCGVITLTVKTGSISYQRKLSNQKASQNIKCPPVLISMTLFFNFNSLFNDIKSLSFLWYIMSLFTGFFSP